MGAERANAYQVNRQRVVDPLPGPARPPRYPAMHTLVMQRAAQDPEPANPVLAPHGVLRAAKMILGRFQPAVPVHRQRDLARWIEGRLRADVDRQLQCQQITRYAWDMA
eukprot:282092-Pyramimonas_sp.AAC.1